MSLYYLISRKPGSRCSICVAAPCLWEFSYNQLSYSKCFICTLFISLTLATVSTKGILLGGIYTHWWKIKCFILPFWLPKSNHLLMLSVHPNFKHIKNNNNFFKPPSFHSRVTEAPSHERAEWLWQEGKVNRGHRSPGCIGSQSGPSPHHFTQLPATILHIHRPPSPTSISTRMLLLYPWKPSVPFPLWCSVSLIQVDLLILISFSHPILLLYSICLCAWIGLWNTLTFEAYSSSLPLQL